MTPADARVIVERHRPLSDGRCDECGQHWQCDAHASATAYLTSVAVVEAARDLDAAGCWGHSEHGAERCNAGALREALRAYEDAE